MTRYPAWKRHEVNRKWRGVLAVFITITLTFAAINGILRTFSLKSFFESSRWDGKAPYIAAVGGGSGGLFVFNKQQKKVMLFKLPRDIYLLTGKKEEAFRKVSDVVKSKSGDELSRLVSYSFGVPVGNFILSEALQEIDKNSLQKYLKDYVSPANLIVILIKGTPEGTNIARLDAFKLWWQLKSLRINNVEVVNLEDNTQGVVAENNQKVLGVDEESLRLKVSPYTKNTYVENENFDLIVVNASGSSLTLGLAADFASSMGYKLEELDSSVSYINDCQVVTHKKDSYSAKYLAEIFNCDNISQPDEGDLSTTRIKLILGKEFASKYFE